MPVSASISSTAASFLLFQTSSNQRRMNCASAIQCLLFRPSFGFEEPTGEHIDTYRNGFQRQVADQRLVGTCLVSFHFHKKHFAEDLAKISNSYPGRTANFAGPFLATRKFELDIFEFLQFAQPLF